ncbi:MAG: general secretion pathway protein GspK, partial [Firmicutes bacterium]|nr:general secretion pathway protein GspK [Bacillota bacterium]
FVVWAMALIGLVVAACLERNLAEALRREELAAASAGRSLAQSEVARFLVRFLTDDNGFDAPGEEWWPSPEKEDGSPASSGGQSGLEVTDLGSRLNLNTADETALLAFFGGAREPVEVVLDWRDEDREGRPSGAEADYYAGLDPARRPADGFFLSPAEMFLLKGADQLAPILAAEATVFGRANPNLIPPEVFHGLLHAAGAEEWEAETITAQFVAFRQEALTAGRVPFGGEDDLHRIPALSGRLIETLAPSLWFAGRINPNFAGERTLAAGLAQLGVTGEKVRAILARRPFTDFDTLASLVAGGEGKLKKEWIAQVFTLETTLVGLVAVGRPPAGGEYRIEAVLERFHPSAGDRLWRARVVYWQENYLPEEKATGEKQGGGSCPTEGCSVSTGTERRFIWSR